MYSARVLLVEDDPRIISFLQRGLQAEGYHVEVSRDGQHGYETAREGDFDLVILDRMLPRLEGLDVCTRLRADGCRCLILMLTAKAELQDRIAGLKHGADDYLTKPFSFDELVARMQALLRRKQESRGAATVLSVGNLQLDFAAKTAYRGERRIDLTAKEYALLAYLMGHAGTVISRAQLLRDVWCMDFDPGTKVVDVYVRYLRRKIEHDGEAPLVRTVRGFGYMISADPD
ncbi:response regulator transcription factor [Bordetella tumulicola]|uniref:response regulator transcription factor n=1 Tax=Bordetella tumulicola TaxID=1649133 RepID=UPI0039F10EBC